MSKKTLAAFILISLFTCVDSHAALTASGSLADTGTVQGPQMNADKISSAYTSESTTIATAIPVTTGDTGTSGMPTQFQQSNTANWAAINQPVADPTTLSLAGARQMYGRQMGVPAYTPPPGAYPTYGTTNTYPYGAPTLTGTYPPSTYPYGAPTPTGTYPTSAYPYGTASSGYSGYPSPVPNSPYPYRPPVNGVGGMSPSASPLPPSMAFGGLAFPGMDMYNPQIQQMYRNQQLKAMGYGQELDPATKKAILNQAASTFRLVASMSNGSLANEDMNDLKKWRQHLRQLTKLSESKLAEFINQADDESREEEKKTKKDKTLKDLVSEQLDRISTAIRDPESLRNDPDAKTMPETEYKEDHRETVNDLIAKWKTSNGLQKGKKRHTTKTTTNSSRSSRTASYTKIRKIDQEVELITEDQRILNAALKGAQKSNNEDYANRIEGALYNMLIAKGRLYDGFMDLLTPPTLESIVDRIRNGGALPTPKSTHTRKSSRKKRSHSKSHTLSNYNPGLDELKGDKEAIDGVIEALEKMDDRSTGSDRALITQLKTNVAKINNVIDAVHNPTMKNPFRGLSEAAKEALEDYKILKDMPLGSIDVESDEDDQKQTKNRGTLVGLSDDQLSQYKSTFQNVVNNPVGNVSPRMPFSEALGILDRITKVQALLLLSKMDTTSDKISSSKMRGKKKARGLNRSDSEENLNKIADYLQWGYFSFGPQIGADVIDSSDVLSTIRKINTYFIEKKASLFKKSAAAATKVEQRDRRQAAQRSLESLGDNMGASAQDLVKKVRNLNGIYDNVLTYYNSGYYKDIPLEEEAEKEEKKKQSKPKKHKKSHHSFWGKKDTPKDSHDEEEDGYNADNEDEESETKDSEEKAQTEADPIQEVLDTPAHLQDLLQRLAEARYISLRDEYPNSDITSDAVKEEVQTYVTLLKQYRMLLASSFLSPKDSGTIKKAIKHLISTLDVAAAESE